jgi:CNT family concentrative nucleoside transporter
MTTKTPLRWVRWLKGGVVLTALGLIVLGSQLDPIDAQGNPPAVTAETTKSPSYLPASEGLDASKMARYESKRAESADDFLGRALSLLGIPALVALAWLMSNNRRAVSWRLVLMGVAIQAVFAVFILWTPVGKFIFSWLNDAITRLLDFTIAGTAFLLGDLVTKQFTVAFNVLPTIIFFSALMTVFYHLGLMQAVVRAMSGVMQKAMGTSGAETLSATANIFVGQTEAPLVIKPYVAKMTQSELMVVMVGGFATVAGGVMAAYVGILRADFPDIAGHLLAASVMSAPAALVIAKVMHPEDGKPETLGVNKLADPPSDDANVIDAAARGASEGMSLAINVGSMLLAFIALVTLINFMIGLPSYFNNRSQFENVQGYLLSTTAAPPNGCAEPKDNLALIDCTHKSLMALATTYKITFPTDSKLDTLSGKPHSAEEDLQKVEALGALVKNALGSDGPLTTSRANADCQRAHNIAACGAILAVTQSEDWTDRLESPDLWPSITLEWILGWLFFPLAFIMGVPLSDCQLIGQLLGQKLVLNEFIAYLNLGGLMTEGLLQYRSIVIATYALCGFANFGSIAIQIGGIGGIAPSRRQDLARMGLRAMIGGTIAAFMTATIAGALI